MRTPFRTLAAAGTALTLTLAACGGSDDASDDGADTEASTETADETPAEPADDATDDEATDDEAMDDGATDDEAMDDDAMDDDAMDDGAMDDEAMDDGAMDDEAVEDGDETDAGGAAEGAVANLVEWAIEAPTTYVAGEITFTATNGGNFPHELVVIAAESYETLPLEAGGAVIESDLPTGALIARTARLSSGQSEDLVVDLAPGAYVLVCNLGSGANSHAGLGQRLDITVTG
ncbi:MAG: hypothetical protein AAGG08_05435 [Actinomycetota bacterium]